MKQMKCLPSEPQEITSGLVLENLLVNMPGHVFWKNLSGHYLGCNDRQAESLGFKRGQDVIGKTDFDLPWDKGLAEKLWLNDKAVMEEGLAITIEEPAMVGGHPATVLSLKAPLKNEKGELLGMLGISVDITQQKRIEKRLIEAKEAAEAAYYAKTAFLDNMRHSLRTPVAGIQGCAKAIYGLVGYPDKVEEMKEYAEDLVDSSQALLKLLNHVLESIQVADGTFPLIKQRFDLRKIVEEVIQLNLAFAEQKKLSLSFSYDDHIPGLLGDPRRIHRILLELVTNALHFTERGCVKINTALVRRENQQVIVKLQVVDTGIGISDKDQESVFTRFKSGAPAYKGNYGTGLGLSMVKMFMDELEGEIFLESDLGRGSSFTCILPLKVTLLTEPEIDQHVLSPLSKPALPSYPIKVLLVEDNTIAAKVAVNLLKQLGCQVEVAVTAQSALAISESERFDLIFMDLGLPDGTGDQVARMIKENAQNSNQKTPIIAVTAHGEEKDKYDSLDDILVKPLSEEMIMRAFEQFLK